MNPHLATHRAAYAIFNALLRFTRAVALLGLALLFSAALIAPDGETVSAGVTRGTANELLVWVVATIVCVALALASDRQLERIRSDGTKNIT